MKQKQIASTNIKTIKRRSHQWNRVQLQSKVYSDYLNLITSSESTFHPGILTSLLKLDQIKSFAVVGVIYHRKDLLYRTSTEA